MARCLSIVIVDGVKIDNRFDGMLYKVTKSISPFKWQFPFLNGKYPMIAEEKIISAQRMAEILKNCDKEKMYQRL